MRLDRPGRTLQMKYRSFIPFALAALLLLSAGALATASQTVSGNVPDEPIARGSVLKGRIILSMPEGVHVNSNKPESEYAIPTSVRISAAGLKPGLVEYPAGKNRRFQWSDAQLNVYEGEVSIPFSLDIPRKFRSGQLAITAVVDYQACTDEICYQPKRETITLYATVK